MKWYYNLKRAIRNTIAVVAWVPLVAFACAISGSIGEDGENMQAWQAVVIVVLLAVGVVFTVFAVLARKREKAAENAENAPPARTATQPAAAPVRGVATAVRKEMRYFNEFTGGQIKTVTDDKAVFSDKPVLTVTLTRSGSEAFQDNIAASNAGDNVIFNRDEKGVVCFASGGEVGYLPDRAAESLRGKIRAEVAEIPYDADTDKYSVVVTAYLIKGSGGVSFPINTKIRGVTFEGRQAYLSESRAGDVLSVRHAPTAQYPNTIAVINTRTGKTLGSIGSELADELLGAYGAGCTFNAEIIEVTGGADGAKYGCNIVIDGRA